MAVARKFYEGTLGLQEFSTEGPGFVLFVYRSHFAGNNEATVVTWIVADVEQTVLDFLRILERGESNK